jgi:hypothetical protein
MPTTTAVIKKTRFSLIAGRSEEGAWESAAWLPGLDAKGASLCDQLQSAGSTATIL